MWLRDHLPHLHRHDGDAPPANGNGARGEEPIPGYSRMSTHDVVADMHNHSQAELARIEEYERSHENRQAVLNKLHYMRGREPWDGYDDMPEEEILARLPNADDATIKRVRDYEHKFHNRPRVVEEAMRLHHEKLAAMGPREVPPYVPGGAA